MARDCFESIKKHLKNYAKSEGLTIGFRMNRYSSCTVTLKSAPYPVFSEEKDYAQINQYYIDRAEYLTSYGRVVCETINNIIKKTGDWWDKSDPMTDYFHTAFYYHIHIGSWDKPFEVKGQVP